MNDKFIFDNNGKTLQIRFAFPDKRETFRRFSLAILDEKITNPEDDKDFVWNHIDTQTAKCNLLEDIYNKDYGRFKAFDKLVKANFVDKKDKTFLYAEFFNRFGIPPKPRATSFDTYLKFKLGQKQFHALKSKRKQ